MLVAACVFQGDIKSLNFILVFFTDTIFFLIYYIIACY